MQIDYKEIMQAIYSHKDFGKKNPIDIGNELGYSQQEVEEMIRIISGGIHEDGLIILQNDSEKSNSQSGEDLSLDHISSRNTVEESNLFHNEKKDKSEEESNTNSIATKKDLHKRLSNKFEEIFGYKPGDSYKVRIKNALQVMCQNKYFSEDLIEIIDTSILHNGRSGLVLTIDAICIKDAANRTTRFIAKYADIKEMDIEQEEYLGSIDDLLNIHMNDGKVYTVSNIPINKYKLKKFLDSAIAYSIIFRLNQAISRQ